MSATEIISPTNVSSWEPWVNFPLYDSHDPIYIEGNVNFTAENGVIGGNGIQSDPYIIEGWGISVSSANGIEIRNTDMYFIIRNCYVHDGRYNDIDETYDGIYFYKVQNGQIENTSSLRNDCGIYLCYSNYNLISNNNASNNMNGIYLCGSSNNNTLSNNSASNNCYGIYLHYSNYNNIYNNSALDNSYSVGLEGSSCSTLVNNTFVNNGIRIFGWNVGHFTTHNINTTNSVNGKPIYYYKNQNGSNIDGLSVGQVILANCTNFTVKNVACSNSSIGAELAYCNNCSIENSTFNNGTDGIYLYRSRYNTLVNNTVSNNRCYGIHLYGSNYNSILNSNASTNRNYGIYVYYSSYNKISYNRANLNDGFGIYMEHSSNNNISNNGVNSNDYLGIYLYCYSNYNTFVFNNISYNDPDAKVDIGCENNIFHHNNFINSNTVNVFDDGENTKWDDGCGEGNYWSNYIGLDDGSNGRVAGDGIGDTNIPNMGLDSYPLMEPIGRKNMPPVISLVSVSDITANSATITWITDEPSNIGVNYSINEDLSSNLTKYDSTMTTIHTITLTNLSSNTTYYFEVSSTDNYGNTAADNNNSHYYTFTTEAYTPEELGFSLLDYWWAILLLIIIVAIIVVIAISRRKKGKASA